MSMLHSVAAIILMVTLASAEDCPLEGWKCIGDTCYCWGYPGSRLLSFNQRVCQSIGATLPMPKTLEQEDFIKSILNVDPGRRTIWLGLEEQPGGQLVWYDQEPLNSSSAHWNPNVNTDRTGEPLCHVLVKEENNTYWDAVPCNGKANSFLCETPRYCTGKNARWIDKECIRFIDTPKTWAKAEADCETGGDDVTLTSPKSELVMDYVQTEAQKAKKRVWLGATDTAEEDTWVWTATGEIAVIEPSLWGQGQPDNANGNEDCLIVRPDRKLNDANCNWRLPYFCSKPFPAKRFT